jgi:hypothetical protein
MLQQAVFGEVFGPELPLSPTCENVTWRADGLMMKKTRQHLFGEVEPDTIET